MDRFVVISGCSGGGKSTLLAAFARRAMEVALADRDAATRHDGWVFFDRGLSAHLCHTSVPQ